MQTTDVKEQLHHFIEIVDKKRAQTIYSLFKKEIEEESNIYDEKFKKELDRRYDDYVKTGKAVSEQVANKRIKNILSALKKK